MIQNISRRCHLLQMAFFCIVSTWTGCAPQYPNCDNDEHCREAEFCVNGQCQQCRPDANDCPDGQTCNDGRCDAIPDWCSENTSCPAGQECQENRCVDAAPPAVEETPVATPTPPRCRLDDIAFDYDSSDLSESARNQLQNNATCIQSRNIPSVRITGHTDPRGTEEYNLALGDRRSRSVRTYLERLGVSTGTMRTNSMGEEMSRGTNESSWTRDRRVEFNER